MVLTFQALLLVFCRYRRSGHAWRSASIDPADALCFIFSPRLCAFVWTVGDRLIYIYKKKKCLKCYLNHKSISVFCSMDMIQHFIYLGLLKLLWWLSCYFQYIDPCWLKCLSILHFGAFVNGIWNFSFQVSLLCRNRIDLCVDLVTLLNSFTNCKVFGLIFCRFFGIYYICLENMYVFIPFGPIFMPFLFSLLLLYSVDFWFSDWKRSTESLPPCVASDF